MLDTSGGASPANSGGDSMTETSSSGFTSVVAALRLLALAGEASVVAAVAMLSRRTGEGVDGGSYINLGKKRKKKRDRYTSTTPLLLILSIGLKIMLVTLVNCRFGN